MDPGGVASSTRARRDRDQPAKRCESWDLTDNERLEAEGKGDQASSDIKQAGEKVKDAFKH